MKLTKKQIYIVILIAIMFVIGYGFYYHNRQLNNKYKMIFKGEVGMIYMFAERFYEDGVKSFGRVNGVNCETSFSEEYTLNHLNYYVSFDELGKINKIYVSSDKYKYIDNNVDASGIIDDEKISKIENTKFDCDGNILVDE